MQNLLQELETLLATHSRFVQEGKIIKQAVIDAAQALDADFLQLLMQNESLKKHFFQQVGDIMVFDKVKLLRFVSNKAFLADSYTEFKNKIGLAPKNLDGLYDAHLSNNKEVVLVYPYKDCMLEGGQTKEEQGRNELFWNETLAPDDIDRLKQPKAFTNLKRYTSEGVTNNLDSLSLKDNFIIKGNNLLALYSLLPIYRNKVKLIYIDPPYNTGNDSFRYNDSFNHSTWLTFMKDRLKVARELLREDGSIFISIDQKEIAYLTVLMDEIFGNQNKKNIITIKRSSVSGAKVINPGVVNVSEYVLIYSKNTFNWKPNRVFRAKERDDRYNTFIENFDTEIPEKWSYVSVLTAFANKVGIDKSKLKKYFGDEYSIELERFFFENANNIIRFAGLDDSQVSEEVRKLKYLSKKDSTKTYSLARENRANYYLYKGNAALFFKDRLIEIEGKKYFGELISDIWDDVLPNDIHNEGGITLRKGKKPEKLISRIVELGSSVGDIVMDFFVGSGTTAAVATKMNRHFIGIEQMDYIEELPVSRLVNTIKGEQSGISKEQNWQGGGSFVYLELAKANQHYVERIQGAETTEVLLAIWKEMQAKAFMSYKVSVESIDKEIKAFEALPFVDKQRFLISVLDKNMLYVPHCDMYAEEFGMSEVDIKGTEMFYGME